MHIHYRKYEHAVCLQNNYGYFEELIYVNAKRNETYRAQTKVSDENEWPIMLKIVVPIHNHEDLEQFIDMTIDAFNMLRGEHGEDEVISPSAMQPVFTGMQK